MCDLMLEGVNIGINDNTEAFRTYLPAVRECDKPRGVAVT